MSRIKKDQTKFCVEAADSPMFPGMNHYINSAANSPVSDLAQNLSGAYLGSTPRRRVIESASPAPVKTKYHQHFDLIDSGSAADLPLSENRIQKNSPKNSTGKAATGPLATRNRVIPWRLGPCHGNYDKENISSAAEGSNVTTTAHDAPSILSHINSPPAKRLGHVLISPLKPRHPLEDYDPNSQDSGFGNSVPEGEEFRGLENSPSLRAKLASSGFHIEVSKNVKVEEHGRFVHQNENFEISRQISITSTSSVDESPLTSPSRPLAHSQQSNSATPGKKVSPHRSPRSLWSNSKYRSPLRHSHSSGAESIDDGFLEIFELEKASQVESSEAPTLPAGIGNLLSKPIVRSSEVSSGPKPQLQNPTFRRCISLVETVHTPPSSRARLCLFRDTKQTKSEEKENSEEISPGAFGFKRPEPPEGFYANARGKKRRCMTLSQTPECDSPSLWSNELSLVEKVSTPPVLQRSVSDSEAAIKHALFRSSLDPDLIGDFTRPYSLPLIPGRHQDLKTITSDTLAGLLHGKFGDCVDSFSIIDCRYPYEYEGGHIKGAKNLFTHEQILKEFINNREETTSRNSSKSESGNCKDNREESEKSIKRDILVFHCEFSSERGPRLSRFLRNSDRDRNKECYPALHYPEIYLLHGGYKEFFDKHSDLCEPCSYLPMADPRYESDLRTCRAKSKSWTGGVGTSGMEGSRMAMRGSLKRLGL